MTITATKPAVSAGAIALASGLLAATYEKALILVEDQDVDTNFVPSDLTLNEDALKSLVEGVPPSEGTELLYGHNGDERVVLKLKHFNAVSEVSPGVFDGYHNGNAIEVHLWK